MEKTMTEQSRRKFIATSVAAGAAVAATSSLNAAPSNDKKFVVHQVFFWLKNPDSKEDVKKLIAGLETLRGIDLIKQLRIGVPARTVKRDVVDNSYQVSELMFFDDAESQDTYQAHPIHKQFVENYSHLWTRVVVYDSIEV
jgi:hypothetical protein